jgi:hypothetical protein
MMKNRYVNVHCPTCNSHIRLNAKSVRSDAFYCPVCEQGEIQARDTNLIQFPKSRTPVLVRVPVLR